MVNNTGHQPLGLGVVVQERKGGGSKQLGGRYNSFGGGGGGGGSQERDLGTPPLAAKPPRHGGGASGASTTTLSTHDSDVELDRLWERFNSLKGELPATSNTPPPTEHNSYGASGSGARRTGAGGDDTSVKRSSSPPSCEQQEAWAHRREIAGKLEDIQRALAAKAEYGRRRQDELEGLHQTIEELETYVELEASKRFEAECRAQNLEAGLQVLADRCDLEIAARETAEDAAKRYMDLIAEARAAWQKTQDIVQNKERELAAAERRADKESGGGDDLQRRLEDARREKEMDRQYSASLKLALEGGTVSYPSSTAAATIATTTTATAAAAAGSSRKAERRRSAGSLVNAPGDNDTERRAAAGTRESPSSAASQKRLSLDPSRVAAAEARLQAAIDEAAAAAAAATPNKIRKETSPPPPPQQQRKAGQPKQSQAPHRRQRQQKPQQQQQKRRGNSEKTASRPRIVPLTKDRPELGGGDVYRSLGGSYHVATATTSINDSGSSGPCTYSGTALNHDRYPPVIPKEASYVNDYFSVGDDERSLASSVGVDERYGESSAYRDGEKDKDGNRRLGVCRETMVKLKGTVGSAVVKAMNDGGKNMKVHDSKVRDFFCFLSVFFTKSAMYTLPVNGQLQGE